MFKNIIKWFNTTYMSNYNKFQEGDCDFSFIKEYREPKENRDKKKVNYIVSSIFPNKESKDSYFKTISNEEFEIPLLSTESKIKDSIELEIERISNEPQESRYKHIADNYFKNLSDEELKDLLIEAGFEVTDGIGEIMFDEESPEQMVEHIEYLEKELQEEKEALNEANKEIAQLKYDLKKANDKYNEIIQRL